MTSEIDLARFASIISHELAQPLHVATGYLEMVQSEFGTEIDPMALQWLEQSSGSLEKVIQLVQDMVTFARAGANGASDTVDLNVIAESAVAALEVEIDACGASVEVEPMASVTGDEEQLTEVLENLIANALKFVTPGIAPRVTVSAEETAEGVMVNVDDNGPGIPGPDREQVLELFRRGSVEEIPGTGLGLALCRRILEGHGGRIWIEDSALGGSRVRFVVPGPNLGAVGSTDVTSRPDTAT